MLFILEKESDNNLITNAVEMTVGTALLTYLLICTFGESCLVILRRLRFLSSLLLFKLVKQQRNQAAMQLAEATKAT